MGGHGGSSGYKKVESASAEMAKVKDALHGGLISIGEYVKTKHEIKDKYDLTAAEAKLALEMTGMKTKKEKQAAYKDAKGIEKPTDKQLKDAADSAGKAMGLTDSLGGDKQPPTGRGVPRYNNTKTQKGHPQSFHPVDLAKRLGLHTSEEAKEFVNALNEPSVGGFTWGWDSAIRAYQRGKTRTEIKAMQGTMFSIAKNFGGDEDAYFAALKRKADKCEELIDRSPKWAGKETYRGFHGLSSDTMAALANTDPGAIINLNAGTASWSSSKSVAQNFAGHGYGSLVAHVSGQRRGTSVKAGSHFKSENEVLCSRREAFRCIKKQYIGGVLHAWYEVVDTDYDWS